MRSPWPESQIFCKRSNVPGGWEFQITPTPPASNEGMAVLLQGKSKIAGVNKGAAWMELSQLPVGNSCCALTPCPPRAVTSRTSAGRISWHGCIMQTSQRLPEGFAVLRAGPKSCEGDRAQPCANSPCRSAARLLPGSAGGEQSAGRCQHHSPTSLTAVPEFCLRAGELRPKRKLFGR